MQNWPCAMRVSQLWKTVLESEMPMQEERGEGDGEWEGHHLHTVQGACTGAHVTYFAFTSLCTAAPGRAAVAFSPGHGKETHFPPYVQS